MREAQETEEGLRVKFSNESFAYLNDVSIYDVTVVQQETVKKLIKFLRNIDLEIRTETM